MLGPKQEAQGALFYEFSIDDQVPQGHLLLSIDQFVDLSGIRQRLSDFYSHTDRPSIDPNDAPRAEKEYLDVLDQAAFGTASEFEPQFTSNSDPAGQCAAAHAVKMTNFSSLPPPKSSAD